MAVVALATVEQVKGYLTINSSADDALLARLVDAASGFIQQWLNRSFGPEQYTDTVNGTGGDTLLFNNYPVTAVAGVVINGQVIPVSTSFNTPGYVWNDNSIALRGYVFVRGKMNVSLTYTAGYSNLPPEITQSCVEMVSARYREKDRIGLESKGLAGETTAYSQRDMPAPMRTILNNYRRVAPL
jgi:hypothetical protein